MKITIIMVTKNRSEMLPRAVNSFLSQVYEDKQLIIIDGASEDGSIEFLNKLEHEQIIWISEEDSGIYDALNKGIRLADGEIVGVLHSDDFYCNSNVLCKVAEAFFNQSKLDFVSGSTLYVSDYFGAKIKRVYNSTYFKKWMLRFGFIPSHTATFCKYSLLMKLQGYNTKYKSASDFEFYVRALNLKDIRYALIPDYWNYMSTGGVSNSGWRSVALSTKEQKAILLENNIYSNYFFLSLRIPIKIFSILKYHFKWEL
jgi:glycosyltransferase involved in cell wall biosynthesis